MTAPRRSRRARKRPESIYDAAREAAKDEVEDQDDAEEESDVEEEYRQLVAKKRKKTTKAKRSGNALFEACLKKKHKAEAEAEALGEAFESRDTVWAATATVLRFLFLACGASDVGFIEDEIDAEDLDADEWRVMLDELTEQLRAGRKVQYKLASSRDFAAAFGSVFRKLGGTPALKACADMATNMSAADVASARHVATAAAMSLGEAAARSAVEVEDRLRTAARQRATATGRKREAIATQEREWRTELKSLDASLARVVEGVVAARYRDARPEVRMACAEGMASWIDVRPAKYVADPRFVKYLAWMLHFREASDRSVACRGLERAIRKLDRDNSSASADVVTDAVARLAEMARRDVDAAVRLEALRALRAVSTSEAIHLDDETVDVVTTSAYDAILDKHTDVEARHHALAFALDMEDLAALTEQVEDSTSSSQATRLYSLARFIEGKLLADRDTVSAHDVATVFEAFERFNREEGKSAALLRDWSAYVEVLGRDDVDTGKCRRAVAVLAGLLSSAIATPIDDHETVARALPGLLGKYASGETAEIVAPLLAVASQVAPLATLKQTVAQITRTLDRAADPAVVEAAAAALAGLVRADHAVIRNTAQQKLLEGAVESACVELSQNLIDAAKRGDADALGAATSRLAAAVAGGLDVAECLEQTRGTLLHDLAEALTDNAVASGIDAVLENDPLDDDDALACVDVVVDALRVLRAVATSRTQRALATLAADTAEEGVDSEVARFAPRALVAALAAGSSLVGERLGGLNRRQWLFVHTLHARAAPIAADVLEAGDRRFAFYDGLEHLALTVEEASGVTMLLGNMCRRHARATASGDDPAYAYGARAAGLIDASETSPRSSRLLFDPILKVAVAECRRLRQFKRDEGDNDVGPAVTLLSCAAAAGATDVLSDSCARLHAVFSLDDDHDVDLVAQMHIDALHNALSRNYHRSRPHDIRDSLESADNDDDGDDDNPQNDGMRLRDLAATLAAASGFEKHPNLISVLIESGVHRAVEDIPATAQLLPMLEPYLDLLKTRGKRKRATQLALDVESLAAVLDGARQHATADAHDAFDAFEAKLRSIDVSEPAEKSTKRVPRQRVSVPDDAQEEFTAAPPMRRPRVSEDNGETHPPRRRLSNDAVSPLAAATTEHNDGHGDEENVPAAQSDKSFDVESSVPIKNVTNVAPRRSSRSRRSTGSRHSRTSGMLAKIDEDVVGEEADQIFNNRRATPRRRLSSVASDDGQDSPMPASRRSLRMSDDGSLLNSDDDEPMPQPRAANRLSYTFE